MLNYRADNAHQAFDLHSRRGAVEPASSVGANCGDNPVSIFNLAGVREVFFMSSTSNHEVRPATRRDAEVIAKIHGAASLAYWRDAIEYAEPQVYVALADAQVVGFVGFDRSRDKGTPPTTGEVWAIHVLAAQQGRGAGLALWDAAREGLLEEGCTQVTLWLPLAAERALRFFELAGFKREMNSIQTVPAGSARIERIRLKRALT